MTGTPTRTNAASQEPKILADVLSSNRSEILKDWINHQSDVVGRGVISASDLSTEATEFIDLLISALRSGSLSIEDHEWNDVRDFVASLSKSRAQQGFSPVETATFVFSLKQPLFGALRSARGSNGDLADQMWNATTLLDSLGLHSTDVYQRRREEVIARQQQDMLELSTPVVVLWDGILALPMIGTLDSSRTQIVMESLLQRIVETGADFAILDITGVPTVDTLTAQHLLKTVTAARLMGAECVISGIRPQIAQTIVHLGVDLGDIVTKATLADAFGHALARSGRTVVKTGAAVAKATTLRGLTER
ncbi:MAG TPA: STAS domain-containing protein [Gemmatimonadaceae bacterium]|nr:STAS domain-containing protein [Gemmatimonadaceae bacterium]